MSITNIHVNDKTLSIKENNHDNYVSIPAPDGVIVPDQYTAGLNPDNFTYTIQPNVFDGNLTPMPFSIANGGQIKVEDIMHIDIESRTQIHLLVEANDQNSISTTFKFNLYINIVNVYESLVTQDISFNILETLPFGAMVGDISGSITFLDHSKSLGDIQYTIMTGNSGEIFSMDNSGTLSINTTNKLDQDVFNTIDRDIVVSVNGNNKYEVNGVTMGDLTLVRGYTYKFIQSHSSNDNRPISFATLTNGTWTDPNSNYLVNVHYYLDDIEAPYVDYKANMISTDNRYVIFSIPNNSPTLLYYYSVDYIDMGGTSKIDITDKVKTNYSQYNMNVRMLDGFSSDDTTVFTNVDVYVEDVYEQPIVSSKYITIEEDAANDQLTYDLKDVIDSIDITKSEADHLAFTILSGNSGETFKMGSLGNLLLNDNAKLNLEDHSNFIQYNLGLNLNDGTSNVPFNLDISINNVYEALQVQDISFNVNDISPNGTIVGDISDCITFIDYSKKVSDIQYSFISGNSGEAFELDNSGVIRIKDKDLVDLDNANNMTSFTIRVQLDDGITQKQTNIHMNILDVYDDIQIAPTHIFNIPIDSISGDELGIINIIHRDGESHTLLGEIINNTHTDFKSVGDKIIANNDQIQNRYRSKQTIVFTMQFTDISPIDTSQTTSEITINFICPNGKISTTIGDPYITPIYGNMFKLPSKNAYYRVFSNLDNSIVVNCETFKITRDEDNDILDFSDTLMKRHNLNIDKSSFSLLDECFIRRAFIKKGRSDMIYNFENGIIERLNDIDGVLQLHTDERISRGMDDKISIDSYNFEKNTYNQVSFKDDEFGKVTIKLHIFPNKQIRSGITIATECDITLRNSRGYILCAQPIQNIDIKCLNSCEEIGKALQISQDLTKKELFIYNKQGYEVPIINLD